MLACRQRQRIEVQRANEVVLIALAVGQHVWACSPVESDTQRAIAGFPNELLLP
jgi:hypothetical protein